jgi:hypothetical protein
MIRSVRFYIRCWSRDARYTTEMSIELVPDKSGRAQVKSQAGCNDEVGVAASIHVHAHMVRDQVHSDGLTVEYIANDASDVTDRNLIRVRDELRPAMPPVPLESSVVSFVTIPAGDEMTFTLQ